jgi:hypothetical protein
MYPQIPAYKIAVITIAALATLISTFIASIPPTRSYQTFQTAILPIDSETRQSFPTITLNTPNQIEIGTVTIYEHTGHTTEILLTLDGVIDDTLKSAGIHQGACDNLSEQTVRLNSLFANQSVTVIPLLPHQLLTYYPSSVIIRASEDPEAEIVACGTLTNI